MRSENWVHHWQLRWSNVKLREYQQNQFTAEQTYTCTFVCRKQYLMYFHMSALSPISRLDFSSRCLRRGQNGKHFSWVRFETGLGSLIWAINSNSTVQVKENAPLISLLADPGLASGFPFFQFFLLFQLFLMCLNVLLTYVSTCTSGLYNCLFNLVHSHVFYNIRLSVTIFRRS